MNPNNPPSWLFFLAMAVCVSVVIALMVAIAIVQRWRSGQPLWAGSPIEPVAPGRSPAGRFRVRRRMLPGAGSGFVRKALRHSDGTFAGSQGSRSRSESSEVQSVAGDLTPTLDELAYAMLAVYYRTNKHQPTKEKAIIAAFPNVSSKGAGAWQRASLVYDLIAKADEQAIATRDALLIAAPAKSQTSAP